MTTNKITREALITEAIANLTTKLDAWSELMAAGQYMEAAHLSQEIRGLKTYLEDRGVKAAA
jgi:hypothetical protein